MRLARPRGLHAPAAPWPEPLPPVALGRRRRRRGGWAGGGVRWRTPEARRSLLVTGWADAARWRRAARRRPHQARLPALVHAREAPGSTRPRRGGGRARRQCLRRCRRGAGAQASASRAATAGRPRAAHPPHRQAAPPAEEPTTLPRSQPRAARVAKRRPVARRLSWGRKTSDYMANFVDLGEKMCSGEVKLDGSGVPVVPINRTIS